MQRPPSQRNPLEEAIAIYLSDTIKKDPDYIAKFNAVEYKNHLETIISFIKAVLLTDNNYFAEYSEDALKLHLDVIVTFLKAMQKADPNYLIRFAAGELKGSIGAISTVLKEIDKAAPKLLSQLAAGKLDFLTAAIAVYLKEILTQNPNALARLAAGDSKFISGRFFNDLKVDNKEMKSQALFKNALDLDPFFIASVEKIRAIYSARLSRDSYLIDLFNIRANLRNRLEATLTKLPVWSEIGFDSFGGSETLLDVLTTYICFRIFGEVKDQLSFTSLKEVMSILLEKKTLEDVIKMQESLDKRKSVILETAAGKVEDFDQAVAEMKKTLKDASELQQMNPDFIKDLNKKLSIKLGDIFNLVNKPKRSNDVLELISLLVKLIETKYDIVQFGDTLLPSTHALLGRVQQIYNELALIPNKEFNQKIEILKTQISTVLAVKTNAPRRVSKTSILAPTQAPAAAKALVPPTPPVAKSAPVSSPVPKLSLFSPVDGQTQHAQTLRNNRATAPISAPAPKSSSARDANAKKPTK